MPMEMKKSIDTILFSPTDNALVQLLRYAIVGGTAFVADFGSLYLLTEHAGLHYQLSAAVAFVIGLTVNYLMSIRWVFNTQAKGHEALMEFLGFAIIGLIGLALNAFIMFICADVMEIHYLAGKLISTVMVFFWNFIGRKLLTSHHQTTCKTPTAQIQNGIR